MKKIVQLRRRKIPVGDVADNVLLDSVVLGCALCGETGPASLGEFGDEVPDSEAVCPNACTHPPAAA